MNKFFAALALAGISTTGASAAGMTDSTPVTNWTGFYAGVDLGAANGRLTATDMQQPSGGFFTDLVPAGTEGFDFNNTSVVGGLHAGTQYQFQHFVVGGELSFAASGINDKITSPYFPDSDTETGTIKSFGTAVGRIGYAFDRFMIYAKAGYAGGDVGFRARDNSALVTYQQTNWQSGYALGAGLDYAMTDSMTLGVDYTHVDLGSAQTTGPNVYDSGALGSNPETFRTSATADVLVGRLSFKFGAN